MNIAKQNRLLTGITVLLVIINIAVLATLLLGRPRHPRQKTVTGPPDITHIKNLLRRELAFNDSQLARYLEIRDEHQHRIRELNRQLHTIKKQLFGQALLENAPEAPPDSLLSLLSDRQTGVEKITYQHLLTLSRMCAPEQRVKLEHMVRQLIVPPPRGADGPPSGHTRPGPSVH